jgi:hypothetical protein
MYQWGIGVVADRHLAKRHFDSAAELSTDAAWPAFFGRVALNLAEVLFPLPTTTTSTATTSSSGGGEGAEDKDDEELELEFDWGDEFKEEEGSEGEGLVGWLLSKFLNWPNGASSSSPSSSSSTGGGNNLVNDNSGGGSGGGGREWRRGRGGHEDDEEDGGFLWADELVAFDTLLVLALTTCLLLVLQLRRHQRHLHQQLNYEAANANGAPAQPPHGAYGVPLNE